jgi:hypothetical protein
MEHRWGTRASVDIPVRFRCRASNFLNARLINISLSGALIRTEMVLAPFAPVDVDLNGCTVPSFVVRVESDGIGIQWSDRLPRILEFALLARPVTVNLAPAPTLVIIDDAAA